MANVAVKDDDFGHWWHWWMREMSMDSTHYSLEKWNKKSHDVW